MRMPTCSHLYVKAGQWLRRTHACPQSMALITSHRVRSGLRETLQAKKRYGDRTATSSHLVRMKGHPQLSSLKTRLSSKSIGIKKIPTASSPHSFSTIKQWMMKGNKVAAVTIKMISIDKLLSYSKRWAIFSRVIVQPRQQTSPIHRLKYLNYPSKCKVIILSIGTITRSVIVISRFQMTIAKSGLARLYHAGLPSLNFWKKTHQVCNSFRWFKISRGSFLSHNHKLLYQRLLPITRPSKFYLEELLFIKKRLMARLKAQNLQS